MPFVHADSLSVNSVAYGDLVMTPSEPIEGAYFSLENATVYVDSIPPTVSLISPASGSQVYGTIEFTFLPTDNIGISNCSLYTQSGLYLTGTAILNGASNSITVNGIYGGPLYSSNLQWFISCIDTYGNQGNSTVFNLDTQEDEVGPSGGTSKLEPATIAILYPREWVRGTAVNVSVQVFNYQNKTYTPRNISVDFNINGVILNYQNSSDFIFYVSKSTRLGNHDLSFTVKDERTIQKNIQIAVVEGKVLSTKDMKTTSSLFWIISASVVIVISAITAVLYFGLRRQSHRAGLFNK